MRSGVYMFRNQENGKYYVCCSQNMNQSYKSIIRSLKLAIPWFEISDKDIINFRNKISENRKYEDLQSLKDIKFCREELNDILRDLNFTERERDLVLDYARKRKRNVLNTPLIEDFEKYGEEAFEFVVLEECNPEIMYEVKCYWMKKLDCTNRERGYNVSSSAYGYEKSKESKERLMTFYETDRGKLVLEKLGQAALKINEERKGKPAPHRGIPLSEEHKQKMSEASKRYWKSEKGERRKEEQRGRFVEFNERRKGKPYPEEQLEKVRRFWESERGKALRESSRERMRKLGKSRKGRKDKPLSESHKRKVSEGLKKFYASDRGEELKENLSQKYKSEEHIKKLKGWMEKFYESDKGKEFKEKLRQRNIEMGKKRKGKPYSKEQSEKMKRFLESEKGEE
jgi:hypothetical protein